MFRAPITVSCASRSGDLRRAYAARRTGTTPRIGMVQRRSGHGHASIPATGDTYRHLIPLENRKLGRYDVRPPPIRRTVIRLLRRNLPQPLRTTFGW
jgi:hypothetical protein